MFFSDYDDFGLSLAPAPLVAPKPTVTLAPLPASGFIAFQPTAPAPVAPATLSSPTLTTTTTVKPPTAAPLPDAITFQPLAPAPTLDPVKVCQAQGGTWDFFKQQCLIASAPPPTCLPGFSWDSVKKACVSNVVAPVPQQCLPGFSWDVGAGACVQDKKAPVPPPPNCIAMPDGSYQCSATDPRTACTNAGGRYEADGTCTSAAMLAALRDAEANRIAQQQALADAKAQANRDAQAALEAAAKAAREAAAQRALEYEQQLAAQRAQAAADKAAADAAAIERQQAAATTQAEFDKLAAKLQAAQDAQARAQLAADDAIARAGLHNAGASGAEQYAYDLGTEADTAQRTADALPGPAAFSFATMPMWQKLAGAAVLGFAAMSFSKKKTSSSLSGYRKGRKR